MQRAALSILLGALLATSVAPAGGRSSEVRWVTYVRADRTGSGSLVAVRSGGRGERTLLRSGVVDADAGGAGVVFALVREGETTGLVRVQIGGAAPDAPLARGTLAGIAATHDRVAVERVVESRARVPRHLRGAVEELTAATITVLAPQRRPPGTTHTVASAAGRSYELRFTNDPGGVLSHAEQVNVFVSAAPRGPGVLPGALTVEVRGTEGSFSCGASACFLDWREGPSYAVGEFGRPEDATDFAESLRPMEELAGPFWREGADFPAPQLVMLDNRNETLLESVEGFCECSFRPVDWDADGDRLLVVTRAEGFFTLTEYGPGGTEILHEAAGEAILDASYTPAGVALIESPDVRTPGDVRTLDGETMARDALSFDVEGSILALARADGSVLVRDLDTGRERVVGTGGASVSVSPQRIAAADGDGLPLPPVGVVAAGVAALVLLGGVTILLVRRRG